MTTLEDAIPVLGSDGRVTYMTRAALPTNVHTWDYWAKDSPRSHFRFQLVPFGGIFRIYILIQPPYQGRSEGLVATHRHQDSSGCYICIAAGTEPETVAEALSWYEYWADRTVEYIATGRGFA